MNLYIYRVKSRYCSRNIKKHNHIIFHLIYAISHIHFAWPQVYKNYFNNLNLLL